MPDFSPTSAFSRIAKNTYVILMKDDQGKLTLLADPGMKRPWSGKSKRLADFHAKQCDGMACTFEEAWKLLIKEYPMFEAELHARLEKKLTDTTKTILDQNSLAHGINTNAPRNEDGTILGLDGKPVDPTNN
jgi:hypothetical protein